MIRITGKEDVDELEEKFGDFWKSATIRVSTIEMDAGEAVPNGEIILSRDNQEKKEEVIYQVDNFKIHEKVVSDPYDLLRSICKGSLELNGIETSELEVIRVENSQGYFQKGISESAVFEKRPYSEVNTKFDVNYDVEESEYKDEVGELEDKIKVHDTEPYFDLGKCESTYFDCYFVRDHRKGPKILLFGSTGLEADIVDQELIMRYPEELEEDLTVSILPQTPYEDTSGQRIDVESQKREDGRKIFREELDLDGINKFFVYIYYKDIRMNVEEGKNPEITPDNERFNLLAEHDQDSRIVDYLSEEQDTDLFEVAILNLLSIAGYQVFWSGYNNFNIPNHSDDIDKAKYDEIDIVAFAPDRSSILFIECTSKNIMSKIKEKNFPERVDRTSSAIVEEEWVEGRIGLESPKRIVPCIATPQPEDRIPDTIDEAEKEGVRVLHQDRLEDILERSINNPGTVEIRKPDTYLNQ